jgi:hypothetical protein|tara:strand:+ start:16465 stop:16773 length:309 start_codon:yes stop_codon:yes gene_type:complete
MATNYGSSSPWFNTPNNQSGEYLDLMRIRTIPASPDDVLYEIEPQYNYRPDLLAYDMYGSPKLWWVFAQRNMDTIKDPIYDLKVGTKIYLPKASAIADRLGV